MPIDIRDTARARLAVWSTRWSVFPRLPYGTARDFVSVAIPVVGPLTMQVRPKLGIRDLHALIAAIRAEPGTFSYDSFGNDSAAHLAARC